MEVCTTENGIKTTKVCLVVQVPPHIWGIKQLCKGLTSIKKLFVACSTHFMFNKHKN